VSAVLAKDPQVANPAESHVTKVFQRLKQERDQAQRRIEQLDEALKALTGLGGVRGSIRTRGPA
jgi:hypothetical protein